MGRPTKAQQLARLENQQLSAQDQLPVNQPAHEQDLPLQANVSATIEQAIVTQGIYVGNQLAGFQDAVVRAGLQFYKAHQGDPRYNVGVVALSQEIENSTSNVIGAIETSQDRIAAAMTDPGLLDKLFGVVQKTQELEEINE